MRQALVPPVSEGVYVMIACQRNQSLSILKFSFLFHGFQGSASQTKMTISAPLPTHTSPAICVRIDCLSVWLPCDSRPVAAPGLNWCQQVPEDIAELNNAN